MNPPGAVPPSTTTRPARHGQLLSPYGGCASKVRRVVRILCPLGGVVQNALLNPMEILLVPNNVLVIVVLPDDTAASATPAINALRSRRLKRPNDDRKGARVQSIVQAPPKGLSNRVAAYGNPRVAELGHQM